MSGAYYNEIDPYAAEWLRTLISNGVVHDGDVDERSIADVSPEDLLGYTHVHLFAGIGGWAHAANLADWPIDRPLWTGSCPCQPFSNAGKRKGTADERHLWPHMHRLLEVCRPEVVVGEQVSGSAGLHWLDGVWSDLEATDYTPWAVDFPACAVDAPHIRARLYWCGLADPDSEGRGLHPAPRQDDRRQVRHDADGRSRPDSFWSDAVWLPSSDGKWRRAFPGIPLLAHGVPNRVAQLRAIGNAIVPQAAAEFLAAIMEATS